MDAVDLAFFMLVLQLTKLQLEDLELDLLMILQAEEERKEQHKLGRSRPRKRDRRGWSAFASSLDDKVFRRMFRMPRDSFTTLCQRVESAVGRNVFRSEAYLSERRLPSTHDATEALGGIICGEVKLAVTIRMLAGASYLDLLNQYAVPTNTVYRIFHEGISWINSTFQFPLHIWLESEDWESLYRVSDLFAAASDGVFRGCIGALDGLAVKMKCPTLSDLIPDPGNYFCRKGFYALNVQAICDKLRRFIWVSTGHKGSTHDSLAFDGTHLNKVLAEMADKLLSKGLFFVGDSAFPLLSYLLVPYDSPDSMSPEDAFNYWLSNSRIQIECAFGKYME
jgi:hypothetical protein